MHRLSSSSGDCTLKWRCFIQIIAESKKAVPEGLKTGWGNPQGGPGNWSNGFLSPYYQGTPLQPFGSPILDMDPSSGVTKATQRADLDLIGNLNGMQQQAHPEQRELSARIETYELAFRMRLPYSAGGSLCKAQACIAPIVSFLEL
jgi:hypothetical protein